MPPSLLDKAIRHPGNIIGHRPRQPLGWNLCPMILGQHPRIGHQRPKQFLDYPGRVPVQFLHPWSVIEIRVEELFGRGTRFFHLRTQHR